ncbi:hypothetical protein BC831DRAFT_511721 [Entophlyctis helioformis]|nr:hypothetical protein BC831DRAFT_511721 [Entophlyctis helioformis]
MFYVDTVVVGLFGSQIAFLVAVLYPNEPYISQLQREPLASLVTAVVSASFIVAFVVVDHALVSSLMQTNSPRHPIPSRTIPSCPIKAVKHKESKWLGGIKCREPVRGLLPHADPLVSTFEIVCAYEEHTLVEKHRDKTKEIVSVDANAFKAVLCKDLKVERTAAKENQNKTEEIINIDPNACKAVLCKDVKVERTAAKENQNKTEEIINIDPNACKAATESGSSSDSLSGIDQLAAIAAAELGNASAGGNAVIGSPPRDDDDLYEVDYGYSDDDYA